MAGGQGTSEVDAAIERLRALAIAGDLGALLAEVEARVSVEPARILREAFYLLYELAPVHATRKAVARLRPLFPQTEDFQNDIGFLLLLSGDLEGANAAYGLGATLREERVARHPLASTGLRILHPTWFVGSFGEMGARLSAFAKFKALGMLPPWQVVLPAPRDAIINEPLLDLFSPYLTIVKDGDLLAKMQSMAPDLALDSTCLLLADGRCFYVQQAWRVAEKAWSAAGRGPVVTMPPERISAGRTRLAGIGLPADAWFVALHVRDPSFHGESHGRNRLDLGSRDADIATYIQAIERVVARGGHVVRLGSPKAPTLPAMPGLVDYAHSEVRSPELDIVAIAAARAIITTMSGPLSVSTALGTPGVHTNGIASALGAGSRDIWVPKLLRRKANGRLLSLAQMIDAPFRGEIRGSAYEDYGIEVVPNAPEDIADATEELLDRLDGRPPQDEPEVEAVFDRTNNVFTAPISASFLARHRSSLLPGR